MLNNFKIYYILLPGFQFVSVALSNLLHIQIFCTYQSSGRRKRRYPNKFLHIFVEYECAQRRCRDKSANLFFLNVY